MTITKELILKGRLQEKSFKWSQLTEKETFKMGNTHCRGDTEVWEF